MFGDFSDRDFALVIKSVGNYEKSCADLVRMARKEEIPFQLVSKLVNMQRRGYNLEIVIHSGYDSVLLDTVVSGSKYFFNSEDLRLALCTLVSVCTDNKCIDIDNICRIMREVKKFLSFKISYKYSIDGCIAVLEEFK